MCRKTQFATEEDARFYIKKLRRTSKRDVIPKRAYLCPKCLHWHLTSSEIEPHNELSVQHWRQRYTAEIERLWQIIHEKDAIIVQQNAEIVRLRSLLDDVVTGEVEMSPESDDERC